MRYSSCLDDVHYVRCDVDMKRVPMLMIPFLSIRMVKFLQNLNIIASMYAFNDFDISFAALYLIYCQC